MAKYLDENGLLYFWQKVKTWALGSFIQDITWDSTNHKLVKKKNNVDADVISAATLKSELGISNVVTGVKGNSENSYRTGDVNLTPANIGAATSSHTHGNITNGGDITATAPTIASGDKLIINDESASKITNGPSFGTSTTQFLANNGTWQTPVGTVYSDFTGATASADGTHGLVPDPGAGDQDKVLTGDGNWTSPLNVFNNGADIAFDNTTGYIYYNDGLSLDDSGTLMSSAEHTKLSGIATGAEVNQNAFSTIKIGSTEIDADSKTDTFELIAGSNITLTPDKNNDNVTIAGTPDTKNTAGSTDSSSKLFIVGATSQAANPQTYSQDTAYVGTDGHLYSDSKQVVNLSGSQALTNKTYNGYTLGAACAKAVDNSITTGSTSTNLPTSAAVATAISTAMGDVAGALVYKGTVGTGGTVTDLPANHTKGWYYIVKTAGTFAGIDCEVGDMIICNTTGTTANNAHWDIVQSNIIAISNSQIDTIVAS